LGARKLLAWASLLSGTFSFNLVKMLLTTEHAQTDSAGLPLMGDTQDAVVALNATLGAYILQPAEEEDKFRFSHDRYLQASLELTESQWDTKLMHYVIAKTIVLDVTISDDTALGSKALYTRSRHICLAIDLIKERETSRSLFREVLYQAAETACESGARSTGMFYYAHCLMLLQDDPWEEDLPDVSYQETLQLFVRSAECYWHQGMLDEALALIRTTFKKAKDPVDMASSFILQSRVSAVRGDSFAAFQGLKDLLSLLGAPIPVTTWEECDVEFQKICTQFQSINKEELLSRPPNTDDRILMTLGPIFIELLSAAFWRYVSTCKLNAYNIDVCAQQLPPLLPSHPETGRFASQSGHRVTGSSRLRTSRFCCRREVQYDGVRGRVWHDGKTSV
jgi:hypothetical protein